MDVGVGRGRGETERHRRIARALSSGEARQRVQHCGRVTIEVDSVAGGRGARNDGRLRNQPLAIKLQVTHANLSPRDGAPADAFEPWMPLDVRDTAAQVAETTRQVGREQSLR